MKDGIHIRIVTAASTVYDDMVSYVELPLSGGSVGVLQDHAPMLGAVESGVVTARKSDGTEAFIAVDLGVAIVVHNEATLLVRTAERAPDIDLPRAEAALRRAESDLEVRGMEMNVSTAEAARARAHARIRAVKLWRENG